jgi:hypothetical protein
MRRLRLGKSNIYALIDDTDYPLVSQFKWYPKTRKHTVYAQRHRPNYLYLHNFILGVIGVDHQDGNGLNCQRYNLRPATAYQNAHNSNITSRNKSGLKGVSWSKEKHKWQAFIQHSFLGYFLSKAEAGQAYRQEAEARFGNYALHRSRHE